MDIGTIGAIMVFLSVSFVIVFGILAGYGIIPLTTAYGITLIAYIMLFYGVALAISDDNK